MNPIPDMPFTDRQWRMLPAGERRRLGETWMGRAQPLPLQRRRLPPVTEEGRELIANRNWEALGALVALQVCPVTPDDTEEAS